jgi:hypothetical protein
METKVSGFSPSVALAFAVFSCLVAVLQLHGTDLVFKHPHVEIEPPIDQQEQSVDYEFINTGPSSVAILEVRTECDCIQTLVKPAVVAAGAAGVVTLRFRTRVRNGTEIIRSKVVTDDGEVHEISATAKLRSYVEISPGVLNWKRGEPRTPKEFAVSATGLAKVAFSKVTTVKGSQIEILRKSDDQSILVQVTPPQDDRPFRDILLVSALVGGAGETRVYDLQLSGD